MFFLLALLRIKVFIRKKKITGLLLKLQKKKTDEKPRILSHTLTDDLDKLDEVVVRKNFVLCNQ